MHLAVFHTHKANVTVPNLPRIEVYNVFWKDDPCRREANCVDDETVLGHYKRFLVKDRNWHWINCDAGALTFLKLHQNITSNHKYVWLFEWDARWSHELHEILHAYEDDPSDLLCPYLRRNDRWFHAARRNKTRYVHYGHCEQSVVRVSTRLLRRAFEDMQVYGMFCEMRLPSICMLYPWCRMRDLTYKPDYVGHPFQWPHVTNMTHVRSHNRSLLFHRVKTM